MKQYLQQFIREEDGQDVVEYALVIGLVALGGTIGLGILSGDISSLLTNVGIRMGTAVTT